MLSFAREYFTLWGNHTQGAITSRYGMLAGLDHTVFKPLIWVWEPWIGWHLTTNTGAAWSIFSGNSYALSFVSLSMALLLYYVWWRRFRSHLGMTWALGAIIGGALGNFIDRFRLREVVDFVDVKIPLIGKLFPGLGDPYNFPIFNVADSCAVCGTLALAGYLIWADIQSWRSRRHAGVKAVHPFPEGFGFDDEAKRQAQLLLAQRNTRVELGLTLHVADDRQPRMTMLD